MTFKQIHERYKDDFNISVKAYGKWYEEKWAVSTNYKNRNSNSWVIFYKYGLQFGQKRVYPPQIEHLV
jgi:hypothetical protein